MFATRRLIKKGNMVTVDESLTNSVSFVGRPSLKIIGPGTDRSNFHSSTYSRIGKKVIRVDNPSAGDYEIRGDDPENVQILSNIEIDILQAEPMGRRRVYQYEVIPFKVALAAKNDNESVLEKLAQNLIDITVIVKGDCEDSIVLKHTLAEDRKYWFEGNYWVNCNPKQYPANMNYTYFIEDNSNLDAIYPNARGIPLRIEPTPFDWQIESSVPPSLAHFDSRSNEFLVGEKIKPEILLPDLPGIVATTSVKYLLYDKEIGEDFYEIQAADAGKGVLAAHVLCKTDRNDDIFLMFNKQITISDPPFYITPATTPSFISGMPQWVKLPLVNVRGLPDSITFLFECRINVDSLKLIAIIAIDGRPAEPQFLSLKKGQNKFAIDHRLDTNLSAGSHEFLVSFDSQKYLKEPLKFAVPVRILPILYFLATFVIFLVLAGYTIVQVLSLKQVSSNIKAKWQENGYDNSKDLKFSLKIIPPGRSETLEGRQDKKICKIRQSIGSSRCYKIINCRKDESFEISSGDNCTVINSSIIKLNKGEFYFFFINYQNSGLSIYIEGNAT